MKEIGKKKRNQKGFTMIELIAVVVIMAIIGAVLIPQFAMMTARARMTTDATTVKVVQQQIDLYIQTENKFPGTAIPTVHTQIDSAVLKELVDSGYLNDQYLNVSGTTYTLALQSAGACVYDVTRAHYVLSVPNADYVNLGANDANRTIWTVPSGYVGETAETIKAVKDPDLKKAADKAEYLPTPTSSPTTT